MIWRNERVNLWLRKSERENRRVRLWCYSVKGRSTTKRNHGMWLFGDIFRCSLSRQPPFNATHLWNCTRNEKKKTTNRLLAGDSHKQQSNTLMPTSVCVCVWCFKWYVICNLQSIYKLASWQSTSQNCNVLATRVI